MPPWLLQFTRFAVVGLASNAVLYLAYLGLTAVGIGPKAAMTLLYAAGVLQTFVLNRRWTFQHRGDRRAALFRYGVVYAAGYLINLAALELLVSRMGMPHQLVQAAMILVVAAFAFVMQRCWVFRPAP